MAQSSRMRRMRLVAVMLLLLVLVGVALFALSPPHWKPIQGVRAWAWTLTFDLFPIEEGPELTMLHADAHNGVRAQCVACHGDKTDSELPVHRIHLLSDVLPTLDCQACHQNVDLASRGATTAVNWVDVGFCKECHSGFPGLDDDSHMEAGFAEQDCAECHSGEDAPEHDRHYIPKNIPVEECIGCHGGRVLPWTPLHEREDWLALHGPQALESSSEDCFACHDFGLKFCDECHGEKPPTHLPEEEWLDRHIDAASADTRVCYTCHDTAYCKRCHVNHEDGWMDSHPGFIDENGDESCSECHSRSSCSFCHMEETLPSG